MIDNTKKDPAPLQKDGKPVDIKMQMPNGDLVGIDVLIAELGRGTVANIDRIKVLNTGVTVLAEAVAQLQVRIEALEAALGGQHAHN